jgi:hypothetical protein
VAHFIDEVEQEVDEETTNEVVSEEVSQEVATSESTEDDLPAHYRGKTPAELIKMHQEAESRIGQQGDEVGKLRSIVDDFILKQTKINEPEEAEEIDFFADPDKAVEHKIANHPTLKQLEQLGVQMKQSQTLTALQSKHPDLKDIAINPEFQKWVVGSKIRTELYERANGGYDYDAADELFSTWKSTRQMAEEAVAVERKERKNTLNAASTGGASGSSEAPSKKVYRRADIIELMRRDPKRYQSMSDEIMMAYQEGRVRN